MTKLSLRPHKPGDAPGRRSVPVSVVVLTRDEELNIRRCLGSVTWADQVVVVDSGSVDDTVPVARSHGAEIVEQPWLGFSAQREFALRLPLLRHDWVYFVDADQWISPSSQPRSRSAWRSPNVRRTRIGCGSFSRERGSVTVAGIAVRGTFSSWTGGTASTTEA